MFSRSVSWKNSLLTAAIPVYAPFVMLALFMLLFERQWGNTETMLRLLPIAPGALPAHWAIGIFDWIPLEGVRALIGSAAAPLASAAFVLLIASLGRLGREWLVGGAVAAFYIYGITAYWLLHAIRM